MKEVVKFLALGGIGGPVWFTIITLVCAAMRPEYSHQAQFVSELGASGSPHAALMNLAGFIPSGLMIAALGIALFVGLGTNATVRAGSVFVVIFGLGMALVGIFVCDPGCQPDGTFHSIMHDRISGFTFLSGVIGLMLLGIAFRDIDGWRPVWLYSVMSSVASFYFIIAIIDAARTHTYTGVWQRLLLLTLFLWFGTTGYRLFRLATPEQR